MQWKDSEEKAELNGEEPEAFYEEEYSPLGVKAGASSGITRLVGSPAIWIPAVAILLIFKLGCDASLLSLSANRYKSVANASPRHQSGIRKLSANSPCVSGSTRSSTRPSQG